MRRLSLWVICLLLAIAMKPVSGSINSQTEQIINPRQVVFQSDRVQEFLRSHFGVNENYSWKQAGTYTDQKQTTHTRWQQYFQHIKVQGAQIVLHTTSGNEVTLTGSMVNIRESEIMPVLEVNHVLALQNSDIRESIEENINGNTELLWVYDEANEQYQKAYRFEILLPGTLEHQVLLISAPDGSLLEQHTHNCFLNAGGVAQTAYHGVQTITTTAEAGHYVLKSTDRGLGIETINLNHQLNYQGASAFADDDNYWELNTGLADELHATDAHFCAEQYYDFLMSEFNRNSIDDNGKKLISYLNYGIGLQNAFWNGNAVVYGSGNAGTGTLTTLDIAGHEFTHGLIQHTASLNYSNEPGTLNEAIADMIGVALEFYATPNEANWLIAEKSGNTLRSMSEPGNYNQPSVYHGTNWYFGTGDNGGVHINSGFLNKWFYLIANGGQETNENGYQYHINGMGLHAAIGIVYHSLASYLTPASGFNDFFHYTLQSTADLYGTCSPEYLTVAEAWKAIGFNEGINTPVSLNYADSVSICRGNTVLLGADGFPGSVYNWYRDNNLVATGISSTYQAENEGLYHVTELRCGNTMTSSDVRVIIHELPVVTAGSYQSCQGNPVVLAGFPFGGTYNVANPYSGSSTGYSYTFTDLNGCVNTATGSIIINQKPVVAITNADLLIPVNNEPVLLQSNVNGIFSGTGVTNNYFDPSLFSPGNTQSVSVIYTDTHGCTGSDSATFVIEKPCIKTTEGVEISEEHVYTDELYSVVKLTARVSEESFNINWSLSGSGTIIGADNGNSVLIRISVESQVNIELTNTCNEVLTLQKQIAPAQDIQLPELNVKLYPNPAQAEVYIAMPETGSEINARVIITEATGKVVDDFNFNTQGVKIETQSYPKGVYYVKVYAVKMHTVKKLVIN